MADDAYQKRIQELQKYVPFLEHTIKRLKNETGKLREAQISKLQSLLVILTDPKKKLKYDALRKCEEVILKLYEKVEKKPPENTMQKYMCRNPPEDKLFASPEDAVPLVDSVTFSAARQKLCKQLEVELTPASPSPPPVPATNTLVAQPVVIPTEKVENRECSSDRMVFHNPPAPFNDTRPPNTLNWPNNAFNPHFPIENQNHPPSFPQNQNHPPGFPQNQNHPPGFPQNQNHPPGFPQNQNHPPGFPQNQNHPPGFPQNQNHPPGFPQNQNWKNENLFVRRDEMQKTDPKKYNVWSNSDKVVIKKPPPTRRELIDYSDDFGGDTSLLENIIPVPPPPKIVPVQTRVKQDRIVQEYLEEQRMKQLLKSPSPPKLNKPPLSESDLQDLLSSAPTSSEHSPLVNDDMDLDKLEELKAKLCKELEESKDKEDPLKVSKPSPVTAPKPKQSPKVVERVVKEKSNIFGDLLSSIDEQIMNKKEPKKVEKKEVKNTVAPIKKEVKPKEKDEKKTQENKVVNKNEKTEVPKEKKEQKDVKTKDPKVEKDSKSKTCEPKTKDASKPKETDPKVKVKETDLKTKDKEVKVKETDVKSKDKEVKVKEPDLKSKEKEVKMKETKEKETKSKPADPKSKDPEVKSKENKEQDSKPKSKDSKHKEHEPKIKTETKVKPEIKSKDQDVKKDTKQNEPKKEVKPFAKAKPDKPRRTSVAKEKNEEKTKPEKESNVKATKTEPKFIFPLDQIMKEFNDSMKDKMAQKEDENEKTNTGRLSDKYPHKRKPSTETSLLDEPKIIPLSPKALSPKKPLTTEVHPLKLHDPRLRNGPFSPPLVDKSPPVCQNLLNKFPEPVPKPPNMPFSPPLELYMGNRTPIDQFGNMGNRTPMDPFSGNMTPGDPFGGSMTPSDPFLGSRTPSDPFLAGRTPNDQFGGNRTPGDPFSGARTPVDPFSGARTPVDPFSGARTPVDPFAGSRTPVDPFSTNCDVDMRGPYRNNFNQNEQFRPQEQFRPNQNQFRPNQPNQDKFRPNSEQFRHGQDQFRPNQKQFRHGTDQFGIPKLMDGFRQNLDQPRQQGRSNWDARPNQNQARPELDHFNNKQNHFRGNKEQFRHGDNFRPNKEQFRQNKNKFRPQHEEQFRHKFNPRVPNATPHRPEFQQNQSSQNFNPYDLSQINPIDFYESEDQNHERRNSENFHNQRRDHNRVQRVNPIVRPSREDRGPPFRNRNDEERRSRFEDRFPRDEPDNRRPKEDKITSAPPIETRREDPRKKRFEKEETIKEQPTPEIPDSSKPKEDISSPLDSLYSSLSKPIVGKGYGIQNFRIPKKRKPEVKEEKKEEMKVEEDIEIIEDEKITENEESKENEEIKTEDVKEEKPEPGISKETNEPPKTEAGEKLDMFNKFMKHIFDTCDSSFLLQYLDKCGISFPKSKTKRIRRIIDSESEEDEDEIKEELNKVAEESKQVEDVKVEEPSPVKEVPEPKTPEKVQPETVEGVEEIDGVTETVGERIKNRRRKQLIYSSDSSPEKLPVVTSEESSSSNLAQEKRVTRKATKTPTPKAKRKNALELLQEDLRDMFISEGVLTATGKRMCRMMKEHQETQEMYSQLTPTTNLNDGILSEEDIPLSMKCKNYKNVKKKISVKEEPVKKEGPVEEIKKEELPHRRLRSSPRVLLEKINFPMLKFSDEESSADEKDKKEEVVTFAEPEIPTITKKKNKRTRRGKQSRKRYNKKYRALKSSFGSSSTIDSIIESVVGSTVESETTDTETTEADTLESTTDLDTTECEDRPQEKKQLRKRKSRTRTIESETTTAETVDSLADLETVEPEKKKPGKKKKAVELEPVEPSTPVETTDSEEKSESKRPIRKRTNTKIFDFDEESEPIEAELELEKENKRPIRKRNNTKIIESENDEETVEPIEAETTATDLEEKPEKKKQIKKKRSNWAHGFIKKCKKKTKKVDRSASSLSMNTEVSDQMSVTESLQDEVDVEVVETVEPQEPQETSQQSDEEFGLLTVDIKPDVNYYFNYTNKVQCKICDYAGKFIVHHYRTKHPESEIMISRLHPDVAEQALIESNLNKFEDIQPYEELTSGRKRRITYACRFCETVMRKETAITFLDHVCCHTGEYRYACNICSFMSGTKKALSTHCYNTHPELKKPLMIKATWPSPPNFRIVFGHMCKACNFTQILRKNVEKHVRVSHLDRHVEIVKISMSSKSVPIHNLKSPSKEVLEEENLEEREDTIEDVREKTPEPELEPEQVKEKEPDMRAFLEPDDISLREQKIEEERRKKMAEISSNITPRRSTLQFIDQLKNKLQTANSLIDQSELDTEEQETIDCDAPMDFENHTIKTLNEEIPPEEMSPQDFRLKICSTISLAETDPDQKIPTEDNSIMIASTCSLAEFGSSESESQTSSDEVKEQPKQQQEEENDNEEDLHVSEDDNHISEEEMDISKVELDIPTDSKQKGVMDTIQRLAAKLQNPKLPENISTEEESENINTVHIDIKVDKTEHETREEDSFDVEKVINVGAIEVRIKNKEQIYICKIQDCNFRSSYKITFTKHCSEEHNLTVLCEICARENNYFYFTMTSLFVHLFDAHKSNAKIVPSAKIRLRRISGDLLSKQPIVIPKQKEPEKQIEQMLDISDPVIETIEVNQKPSEPDMGFLQIKDVRTLTEEEEHILQPKKSPLKKGPLSNFTTVQIAPNLAIIQTIEPQNATLPNLKASPELKIVQKMPDQNSQNVKQITTITGVSTSTGRKVIQTKKIMIPIHELPKYVSVKPGVTQKKPAETNPSLTLRKSKKVFHEMIAFPKILDLYKCSVENCSYSTNISKDFRVHMITHKWSNVIVCIYCQEGISTNNLISHIDSVHGHCTVQCAFCFYRTISKMYLLDHQKHVHKHNNEVMPAGFSFELKPKSVLVQSPVNDDVVLPYKCTQDNCDQNFLIADDFMVHLHVSHKKYFTCGICEDRSVYFVTALALIQHYVIHDIARYQCQYCKYGTHSMDSMFTHYARRHSHLGPICYIRQPKDKNHLPKNASDLVTMHMELKRPVDTTYIKPTSTPIPDQSSDQSGTFSSPTVTTTIPEDQTESQPADQQPIADIDVASMPEDGPSVAVDKQIENIDVIDLDASENDNDGPQFSEPYVILKHRNVESKNAVENAVDPLLVDDDSEKSNDNTEIQQDVVELQQDVVEIQPEPDIAEIQPEIVNLTDEFYVCGSQNCGFSSDTMQKFRNHLVICDIMTSSYTCSYCQVKFKTVQALCEHIQIHRKERFTCGLCDYKDRFKSLVIQHLKEMHGANKTFLTPVNSSKADIKKDHFIVNLETEQKDLLTDDSEKIITIPSLSELFGNVEEDDTRFTCNVCQHKTAEPNPILQHMKEVHQIHYTQFYPVDQTKKDLTKDHFLVKSVESTSTEDEPPKKEKDKNIFGPEDIDSLPRQPVYKSEIKCKLCNYNTKVRSNMQRHLQQHIEEKAVSETAPVNPVPCLEKNEKMFDKMTNLAASSHYGRMGGKAVEKSDKGGQDDNNIYPGFIPVSKRFVCGALNCNYLTHGDQMLRHHLTALHADEMVYKCPHCQIDIPSEIDGLEIDQILFHLKMHDLHLYKCPNCEFFHYQKHKLERHISDNHPEENKNIVVIRELDNSANLDDDRPTLPVSFIEQITNAEANEFKPWRCGYCSFKCQSKNEIQNHTNSQHGVKSQFKCAKCKFRCSAKVNFTSHFKRLHPEVPEPEIETVYYKITEEEAPPIEETTEPTTSQPEFDTTPLWMKNKTGVKHIRGILLEETKTSTSPKRTPKIIEKLQEIKSNLGEGSSKVENVTRNLFPEPKEPKKLKEVQRIYKIPTHFGNAQENFYVCPACDGFKTRSVKEFTEHLHAEMNYYRCSCSLCGQRFVDLAIAKQHWVSYHITHSVEEQLNPLTPDAKLENWVEQCIAHQSKTLKNVDEVIENVSDTSSLDFVSLETASPSKLKCEFCDFTAKNMKTLRKHQKRHNDYCPFKCDYCDYKALSVRSIKNHHRAKHRQGEVSYTVVPTQLEENNSLKRKRDENDDSLHPTKIVIQDEASEQVLIEPDVIELEEDPAEPSTTEDSDMQISYGCLHCPRKSNELPTIRKHFFELHAKHGAFKYKKVNVDKSKKMHYKCNFCDWFGDPNALKYHCLHDHDEQIWVPQRNTKLKCSICSVVYSKLKPLKKHFTEKHAGNNLSFYTLLEDGMVLDSTEFFEEKEVAIKCNYCADQFENKDQLYNHHTLLHSHLEFDKEEGPESKKYKCAQCEHASNSYQSMRMHLRRHSKPYNCSLCSFICFYPSQLKTHHIRNHPEEHFVMNDSDEIRKQQLEDLSESMLYLNPNGSYTVKNKLKRQNNTELDEPPTKILVIDDLDNSPVKRNVAKKSTTLPAFPKCVAKKSTANRPKCLEYSFYGTKPCDLNDYKTVMSEINIMGKVMPINVVAMSHVLNLNPVVPLIDISKLQTD